MFVNSCTPPQQFSEYMVLYISKLWLCYCYFNAYLLLLLYVLVFEFVAQVNRDSRYQQCKQVVVLAVLVLLYH